MEGNITNDNPIGNNFKNMTELPSICITRKKKLNFTSKITIAIPVYERTEFFYEAINSAINQTVKCKIIVIDNASSHNYFSDYITSLGNPNIKYYRNNINIGMVLNWNKCIELSETEYITILHDDDALHPNFIEIANKEIENGREYFAAGAYIQENIPEIFNQNIKKISRYYRFRECKFHFGTLSPFPGIIFPVKAAKNIGYFNANAYPPADYDFWIRLTRICLCFRTNTKLAFYRIGPQRETNNCYMNMTIKVWELQKRISLFKQLRLLSEYHLYTMFMNYNPTKTDWEELKTSSPELFFAMQKQSHYENNFMIKNAIKIASKLITHIL